MIRVVRRLAAAAALLLLAATAAAAQQPVPEVRFTVTGFVVEGENPLSAARTQEVLAGFTGDYSGLDGLLAAADALEQAMAAAGHGFHRVSLPPQTLDRGVVTLRVVQFVLSKVLVEGNSFSPSERVLASVPALVPGEAPDTREIARQVAAANRHPTRRVAVSMRQSDDPDAVDAVMEVNEQRPWTLFGLFNNIGTTETGRDRITVGAQHADMFGVGHVLTGSWTTSLSHMGDVRQLGLSYQFPLPSLAGWVSVSYVKSDVDSGLVAGVDVTGAGRFWAGSFRQELARIGALRHAWSIGIQDRDFDNDAFLGVLDLGSQVRSRPLSVRWDGEYVRRDGNISGYIGYVHNFWGGSDNDDLSYRQARPLATTVDPVTGAIVVVAGAKRDWNAVRLGARAVQRLPRRFEARVRMDAQFAGEPLIPGEQIGLGGANSIRGFEERATAGDNGIVGSIEVWTPPIAYLEGLRMLGFMDVGMKDLEQKGLPAAGIEARDTLLSVGLGARWQWRQNLRFALDWGRVIEQAEGASSDPGNSRFHLSVLYRY